MSRTRVPTGHSVVFAQRSRRDSETGTDRVPSTPGSYHRPHPRALTTPVSFIDVPEPPICLDRLRTDSANNRELKSVTLERFGDKGTFPLLLCKFYVEGPNNNPNLLDVS